MTAEQIDILEIVGHDIDLPCEWRKCPKPAEWVIWTAHTCTTHVQGHGLLCDDCLRRILTTSRGLLCDVTGETWKPARRWITRFERINKPPAAGSGPGH